MLTHSLIQFWNCMFSFLVTQPWPSDLHRIFYAALFSHRVKTFLASCHTFFTAVEGRLYVMLCMGRGTVGEAWSCFVRLVSQQLLVVGSSSVSVWRIQKTSMWLKNKVKNKLFGKTTPILPNHFRLCKIAKAFLLGGNGLGGGQTFPLLWVDAVKTSSETYEVL